MKRRPKGTTIDYGLMDEAVALAEEKLPGADEYKRGWSMSEPYVEVWVKGYAKVYTHDQLATMETPA